MIVFINRPQRGEVRYFLLERFLPALSSSLRNCLIGMFVGLASACCQAEVYLEQLPGGLWAKLSDQTAIATVPAPLQGWYLQLMPIQQQQWRQLLTQQLLATVCHAEDSEFGLHFDWSNPPAIQNYRLNVSRIAGYWQPAKKSEPKDFLMTLSMQRAYSAMAKSPFKPVDFQQAFWLPGQGSHQSSGVSWQLSDKSLKPVLLLWEQQPQQLHAININPESGPSTLWQTPVSAAGPFFPGSTLSMVQLPGQNSKNILAVANNGSGFKVLDATNGDEIKLSLSPLVSSDNLLVKMQPAGIDTDQDGADDVIFSTTVDGRIFRSRWQGVSGFIPQQVADLRASQWHFSGNLQVVRARWPDHQNGGWVSGEVLVMLAENEQQQPILMVLPIAEQLPEPILSTHLKHMPIAQPMADLINGMAWYTELPATAVAAPQIIAGVLYLALHSAAPEPNLCVDQPVTSQLLALHIFQASAVYAEKILTLEQPVPARFQILQSNNATQVLQLFSAKHLILPELVGISAACADCTEILHKAKFPKWQRIATYQQENGAY